MCHPAKQECLTNERSVKACHSQFLSQFTVFLPLLFLPSGQQSSGSMSVLIPSVYFPGELSNMYLMEVCHAQPSSWVVLSNVHSALSAARPNALWHISDELHWFLSNSYKAELRDRQRGAGELRGVVKGFPSKLKLILALVHTHTYRPSAPNLLFPNIEETLYPELSSDSTKQKDFSRRKSHLLVIQEYSWISWIDLKIILLHLLILFVGMSLQSFVTEA